MMMFELFSTNKLKKMVREKVKELLSGGEYDELNGWVEQDFINNLKSHFEKRYNQKIEDEIARLIMDSINLQNRANKILKDAHCVPKRTLDPIYLKQVLTEREKTNIIELDKKLDSLSDLDEKVPG